MIYPSGTDDLLALFRRSIQPQETIYLTSTDGLLGLYHICLAIVHRCNDYERYFATSSGILIVVP